jgi:hypothetical protein
MFHYSAAACSATPNPLTATCSPQSPHATHHSPGTHCGPLLGRKLPPSLPVAHRAPQTRLQILPGPPHHPRALGGDCQRPGSREASKEAHPRPRATQAICQFAATSKRGALHQPPIVGPLPSDPRQLRGWRDATPLRHPFPLSRHPRCSLSPCLGGITGLNNRRSLSCPSLL